MTPLHVYSVNNAACCAVFSTILYDNYIVEYSPIRNSYYRHHISLCKYYKIDLGMINKYRIIKESHYYFQLLHPVIDDCMLEIF